MVTLKDCIDQVRSRLNIENSTNITDTEIKIYLNASFSELYALMIEANEKWNIKRINITVTNNQAYTLPNDFWKVLIVNRYLDSSQQQKVPLRRINIRDEGLFNSVYYYNRGVFNQVTGYDTEIIDGYSLLRVYPQNNASGNYEVIYYPYFNDYTDNDQIKIGPIGQHWEEYGILDACIKCCGKDETDPQLFVLQKQNLTNRLQQEAAARDVGQTEPPPISIPWWDRFGGIG